MSRIVCSLLLLAGLAGALAMPRAGAQEPRAPVFAILDVQRILRESTAVKGLSQDIEKRRDEYQAELTEKEEELRGADQELARQRTILTAEVFAQKRKELENQVAVTQREVRERKKSLDQDFAKGISAVQATLAEIAKEIAQKRGLDLVMSKAAVVIVKPEMEITDEALRMLNARLPKVQAATPQN